MDENAVQKKTFIFVVCRSFMYRLVFVAWVVCGNEIILFDTQDVKFTAAHVCLGTPRQRTFPFEPMAAHLCLHVRTIRSPREWDCNVIFVILWQQDNAMVTTFCTYFSRAGLMNPLETPLLLALLQT